MVVLRPAATRGNPRAPWISSHRTFSFPGWWDPRYTGFGALRVINDDRVAPGGHVPLHEHRNMEIFGYVVEGSCRHTDSRGVVLDVPAGAVQRTSAGTGISHTEGNASGSPNRYLQIWIRPDVLDTPPEHDWRVFSRDEKADRFCDVTAALPIKADARLLAGVFTRRCGLDLRPDRRYYLYVVRGPMVAAGLDLIEGDGLSISGESGLEVDVRRGEAEAILFDLS